MSNPLSTDPEKTARQDKLKYIRSIQTPTVEDISFLVSILTDAKENEIIQAATLPVLKKANDEAAAELVFYFNKIPKHDKKTRITLSYALSQLPSTPAAIFEKMTTDPVPQIRKNGVVGISLQNKGEWDALLYDILITEPDSETAFEAASALAVGKKRTLHLFESIISSDLKQNPYIDSEMKRMKELEKKDSSENSLPACHRLDDHVLGKIIETIGESGNEESIRLIEPYTSHRNSNISNQANEIIRKYKK